MSVFFKAIAVALLLISVTSAADIDRQSSSDIEFKNPAIAWKLSIIPGLGQIYNESYAKSAFFMLTEAYFLLQIEKYSHLIKTRNKFAWWFLTIYFMNIVDAYVEAELNTFPENSEQESK